MRKTGNTRDGRAVGTKSESLSNPKRLERRIEELECELAKATQANAEAQAEQKLLSGAFESLSDGVALFDPDDRLIFCNKMFKEQNPELTPSIQLGMTFEDMLRDNIKHGRMLDAKGREEAFIRERMRQHRSPRKPTLSARKDGRWLLLREERTPDGCTFLVNTDLTELKAHEEALKESEARFHDFAESASDWFWEMGPDLRFTYHSDRYFELTGFRPEDKIGTTRTHYVDPKNLDTEAEKWASHFSDLEGRRPFKDFEYTFLVHDGRIRYARTSGVPIFDSQGAFLGYRGTGTDITESKKTEEALQESEAQFRSLIDAGPSHITLKDREGKFLLVNQAFADYFDTTINDAVGKTSFDYMSKDDADAVTAMDRKMLESDNVIEEEYETTQPDASRHYRSRTKFPVRDVTGAVVGIGTIGTDITDQKKRETELAEKSALLQTILDTVPAGIAVRDNANRLTFMNKRLANIYGKPIDELLGMTTEEALGRKINPTFDLFLSRIRESGNLVSNPNYKSVSSPGRTLWMFGAPITREDGKKLGIVTVHLDITVQRSAEEQLRQAQKMEAVGQLTGGVAHDFNNMLGVIIGNLDNVTETLTEDDPMRSSVEAATKAALRGASLNRQLLAFSRQQPLSPKVIDLNEHVSAMLEMLRRTLGETIEIDTSQSSGLWAADVDPAQVESALLNLAVNARDAMPEGGKLTIETANVNLDDDYAAAQMEVTPGEYVMLALTDTGTGMTPETVSRVFEPFFTTKDVGEGTGLGLSMVFGFAKQSGGHVTVYSELGEGTTVKLYLPRARRAVEAEAEVATDMPMARGETVLVVEDDSDLRTLVVTMLGDLGYAVLEAANGTSALAAMANTSRINLLLTDVVLPGGMGGREIAAEAARRLPGVKVLFMSGYPRDAVTQQNRLDDGVLLLEKPFRKAEFAHKLREALKAGD